MEHNNIQERFKEIVIQRAENEKLLEIVSSVFLVQDDTEPRNREAIKEIKDAYTVFLSFNVLDLSTEGKIIYSLINSDFFLTSFLGDRKWKAAQKEYNIRIDRIEEEITNQMRDKLASAKSTNEMFRTFSKFNALFSRPRIRGAIQEYQNQILSSIKKDIKIFRERFLIKYNTSEV